ncbi:putative protein kinase RLK-Pelle-PERK-1 family [Helianthus annuus]|nr:putative protein kinase RLK-Pelle-PERK-1 family [Helianthus annuus]
MKIVIARIIHRDIKSSNILLDDNFDAQIGRCRFGTWKVSNGFKYNMSPTRVMAPLSYMAPEYASSGKLTEVVLELITGRKPVDASQPPW